MAERTTNEECLFVWLHLRHAILIFECVFTSSVSG